MSHPEHLSRRGYAYFLPACLGFSVIITLYFSRHWGLGQDSPLLHYVVFLMQHGYAPYRDIVEMNTPTSYMLEWASMKVFGAGPAAWRCYDIFLMGTSAIAAGLIARVRGRWAALISGELMFLYHLSRSASNVGERDYEMAVLLLVSVAALFVAMRDLRPPLMAVFAAFGGLAAGIKPIMMPLPFVLLAAAGFELKRRGSPRIAPYLSWAAVGALAPILAVVVFLSHYHAWPAFYETLAKLDLYHSAHGNLPAMAVIKEALQWYFYPLWAIGFYAAARVWPHWDWEEKTTFGIACFGAFAYLYQRKGWTYQAATAELFLLIWLIRMQAAWIKRSALPGRSAVNWAAAVAGLSLLLSALYIPAQTYRHQPGPDIWSDALIRDLNAFGGKSLSGHVQCLDWNDGCIAVLYAQRLLPATGFIYDYYLFPADPAPITNLEQARFIAQVKATPPRVIVVTGMDWISFQGFDRLDRWPAFRLWLASNYTLAVERRLSDRPYRVYVLRQD